MTYEEWKAECARMSGEVEKAAREVKAFQDSGDWSSVSMVQGDYYALRDALKALQELVPDENGVIGADQSMSYEDWSRESDRISRDLEAVKIEWDKLRAVGNWEAAQDPQGRYHVLRKRQDQHNARMPGKAKG